MLTLAAGATLALAACETTGARVDPALAPLPEAGTPEAQGRALYVASCGRCHAHYMPRSFTASEWRFYVRKYGRKARLDEGERDLVWTYLRAYALDSDPEPGPGPGPGAAD